MDRLPAVLRVLHDIATENNGERSVDARGLLTQLDLSFVSLLATFRRLLGDAKVLSDMLQSPSLDLAMAVDLISALKDFLQEYRSETFVDNLCASIVEMPQSAV
ncbi:hypothetical protein CHARACLAT_020260 [Characodon lateralis]|uniref:Leptin n=1 Tax=Characodon lateralis TaxID=208331 RepID=A0ABU7E2E8_9TELE|nr:hypothetical protein [Characodon lateralis]